MKTGYLFVMMGDDKSLALDVVVWGGDSLWGAG